MRKDTGDSNGTVSCRRVRFEKSKSIFCLQPATACSSEVPWASSGIETILSAFGANAGGIKAVSEFILVMLMNNLLSLYMHRMLNNWMIGCSFWRTCSNAAATQS